MEEHNTKYKYKLSACVLIKNETTNLNDWLEHYVNQGVEHFFITSNNSTDNIEEFVNNSIYKDKITLIIDNREINIYANSVEHYSILNDNFYYRIKETSEWGILVDIDEFMYGKNGYTLSTYIDSIDSDVGCVYVYWNIFKPTLDSNNNISELFSFKNSNKRINLDLISTLSYEIQFVSKFGKSLFRTSMLDRLWIHKVPTSGKIVTNYGSISSYTYDNVDEIIWSEENYSKLNICLNHYAIRNKSDYEKKLKQIDMSSSRHTFVKGVIDIAMLDDKYIIDNYNFSIYYGIINNNNYIDVTLASIKYFSENRIITIPSNFETRDNTFGDPIVGTHKFVFIIDCNKNKYMFSEIEEVKINTNGVLITTPLEKNYAFHFHNN